MMTSSEKWKEWTGSGEEWCRITELILVLQDVRRCSPETQMGAGFPLVSMIREIIDFSHPRISLCGTLHAFKTIPHFIAGIIKWKWESYDYNIFLITSCPIVPWNISNSNKYSPVVGIEKGPCFGCQEIFISALLLTHMEQSGQFLNLSWLFLLSLFFLWRNRIYCPKHLPALKHPSWVPEALSLASLLSLVFATQLEYCVLLSWPITHDLARPREFTTFRETTNCQASGLYK